MRLVVFLYDVAMAALSVFLALTFRLGDLRDLADDDRRFISAIIPFTATAALSFLITRTYRISWRHASTTDLMLIIRAVTLAVFIYLLLSFVATRLATIPRSFVILSWMILIFLMAGSRVAYRMFRERQFLFVRRAMKSHQTPILIVGGGGDAELFLRSLDGHPEYYPVGVLDDRTARGSTIRNVPILGRVDDVVSVVEEYAEAGDRPRKLVIVDRLLMSDRLDGLVDAANKLGITIGRAPDPTVLRPGVEEQIPLQPISVEDLLGRSQIVLDSSPVFALLRGKRVLITGAGGSIGSEIVRQVAQFDPSAVCLVDASEFSLYSIDAEVAGRWPALERVARLVDVRHRVGVHSCFESFKPDIVFHAAALKHVPLVEGNPLEGIWTNAVGSRHVCDAAAAVHCQAMVLISTDKAVNPANVMGATKRCAESYCQAIALAGAGKPGATRFMAVRFGNVLASTGSVVPLFQRQISAGGPVTVTHPEIVRFFMTIREAVQLVLQASALGAAQLQMVGRIFVLDMGQPVKIDDLARQMIRLAGLQPERDIAIHYTGLRSGEKLYEELFHDRESIEATTMPRIKVASPRGIELSALTKALDELEATCVAGRTDNALALLSQLVPEYRRP